MQANFKCSLLLFLLVASAGAQMMSNAEYKDFLTRLDGNIPQWRHQFEAIDIDKMSIAYPVGKVISGNQEVALKNLDFLHALNRS
jgi:hypothetical protein